MKYLITYAFKKHGYKNDFFHAIVDDPLLALMEMQKYNDGKYRLINVLEIDENKYLTQSIETITNALNL